MIMRAIPLVCLLGLSVLLEAKNESILAPPPPALPQPKGVIFSQDLDPDYTPCRSWFSHCGETCTTQDEYVAFQFRPRAQCPIAVPTEENPSPTTPQGTCAQLNNDCTFSTIAPTCVSWLPNCHTQYSCTTEEVYSHSLEDNKQCGFFLRPPTPTRVCVPVNDSCEWHNPCTRWQGFCGGNYLCGSQVEFARFRNGPTPLCAAPPIFKGIDPIPVSEPVPQGECLYRDGQCNWSQCRSWLGHCQTSWTCGTEYDFQVFQTLPVPPCANPGPDFRPPVEPGVCEYDIKQGACAFNGEKCRSWLGRCQTSWNCATEYDFQVFQALPVPPCANPGPDFRPPVEPGVCEYDIKQGACAFNREKCRSWLGHCQTSWNCGTEYDFQVFQTLPVPLCANPGPDFRPPVEPGVCEYDIKQGACAFNGEIVCEGGKEYQSCGSHCPRTCNNLHSEIFCLTGCSTGCFCPEGTVLHNNQCIQPSQCPNSRLNGRRF